MSRLFSSSSFVFLSVRLVVLTAFFGLNLRAEIVEPVATPMAVGTKIGTAGFGPTVVFTATQHFTASAGYTWLDFNYDTSSSDTVYTGKLNLSNIQAVVNWHPFAGIFHFSAGAFFAENKVSATAQLKSGSTNKIGDLNYTAEQVGTLAGEVELAKGLVPYIGLGWTKKPTQRGLGFFANIGVLYTTSAEARLTTTGGTESNNPTLQSNLRKEEKSLNHDLRALRYYPVVQLGLLYRF